MLLFVLYRVLYKCGCHVLMFNINIINNLYAYTCRYILPLSRIPPIIYPCMHILSCWHLSTDRRVGTDWENIRMDVLPIHPLCRAMSGTWWSTALCSTRRTASCCASNISYAACTGACPATPCKVSSIVVSVCKTLILWVWQKITVYTYFCWVF